MQIKNKGDDITQWLWSFTGGNFQEFPTQSKEVVLYCTYITLCDTFLLQIHPYCTMQHFLHFALPLGQAVSFILIDFLVTLPVWFFYLSLFQKHYGMKIREVDRNQTSESCRRRGKTLDKLSSFSRRCFCVPSSFLLRRIRKYLWKGCQCLLTNLNHCASFASWCVQHFGLSQRKEYLSKKKKLLFVLYLHGRTSISRR